MILLLILSCKGRNDNNSEKAERELIKQASAFGQMFLNKDVQGLVGKTYHGFVQLSGEDKMIKDITASFDSQKEKGIQPYSVSFGKPNRIIFKGDTLQTTLTCSLSVLSSDLKMAYFFNIIAISENKGVTWNFILSSENELRKLYLKLPVLNNGLIFRSDSTKWLVDDTFQNNYKAFWNDFKINYPAFQINNINWDSVYSVNYSKINSSTSDYEFFKILNSSFLALKDAHSGIISSKYGQTDYYSSFIQSKPDNFPGKDFIKYKYLSLSAKTIINDDIFYGLVRNTNVGYIYIGSFGGKKNDFLFIDGFIKQFKDTKGIIIDIRQNGGGSEDFAQIVASRFTNKSVTYRYAKFRNGPKPSDLSNSELILEPGGENKYLKTIVLLTNRHTFSSAEDFTLMLRSLPNVIHIGDTTFGGVATCPIVKTLPNGWTYRMSRAMECDINNKPIKGGIIPYISIQIRKADLDKGVDSMIEKALTQINRK
ncbi:MAG: S41 family peptidase [Prolixibacteraceae bacterium]|nr:S41 family peptidase [Prolixibacteraceae bacterium]